MKIKTEQDVQKLDDKLKSEFGVYVSKYRNPEIAKKFGDLLVFPQFALSWILRPVSISLFLYFIVFYIYDLSLISSIVYGVFGLFLFLVNGLLFGILFALWKMKKDVYGVIEYSLSILKECIADLNQVSSKENRKETLSLLFLGIIHLVTIPMITEVIANKTPFIGDFFSKLFKKILRLACSKIKFNYGPNKNEVIKGYNPEIVTNSYMKSIDQTMVGLDKLLTTILKISQFPITMATIITFSLLGILLYLVV